MSRNAVGGLILAELWSAVISGHMFPLKCNKLKSVTFLTQLRRIFAKLLEALKYG